MTKMRKLAVLVILVGVFTLFTGCVEVLVNSDGSVEYKVSDEQVYSAREILVVDNFMGQVLVEPAQDDQLTIQYSKILRGSDEERLEELADDVTVTITESDNLVNIKTDRPRPRPKGVNSMSVDFRIYAPTDVQVKVRTSNGRIVCTGNRELLALETSNGEINVVDFIGTLSAQTSNGKVTVEDAEMNANIYTSNGGVYLTDVAGNVIAETSNGRINVEGNELIENAKLRTSNGSISYKAKMLQGGIYDLETSNSRVYVWLEPELGYNLDARTSNGQINLDMPIEITGSLDSKHVVGRINGGGTDLTIYTSNGTIQINTWEDEQ